jgi:Virulence-associated protein E/Bifunctional DNA primase/polymerase, N-terminal/Primase C terminal 2 (PriCT-2)
MTNTTTSTPLSVALDYYAAHGAALFPIEPGKKAPFGIVGSWKHDSSRDREQWRRWATDHIGCNFGVVGFASNWIIADIDTSGGKDGKAEALALWSEVCASWGLPGPLPAHVESQSGGFHVYFSVPAGLDASQLRQPDAIKGRINIRCVGYTVAAGSQFESRPYRLLTDAPPHPAPDALIKHCTRSAPREMDGASLRGAHDESDVAALLTWMAARGLFDAYEDWIAAGMALKASFGSDGFSLWDLTHDGSVSPDQAASKWESFASLPTGGSTTLATVMKRAHVAGWSGTIRKSTQSMFQGVAQIAATAGATGGMPMLARGDKQAELWAPVLRAVPLVERTAEHPLMPDTGHPLRAAINEAIPGIMANGNTDALAVIEAVHPETAAKVGTITPTVRARAEAMRQDAEHRLAPNDYTRDHKGAIERDNPDNVRFLLASLNIEIRFNAWLDRVELKGWKWPSWTELSDRSVAVLMTRAAQTGTRFTPAVDFLWRTMQALAAENTQDPARDLLDNMQAAWDGEARLHSWLSHACGVPYDAYHQVVGATILLGLVARIRDPGCKFDLMPVFVSEKQGTSKSTLARMLALNDAWFVENVALGESSKELVLLLAGKSVTEISEMRTRGEVDAVKAMISATHDEGRPAYGRATVKRPRRNIFIGTTNRLEFLDDQSGGRRFLPIAVQGEIDLEFVRMHLPQLVGEAATLQARGADINLPREVWGIAGEHQAAATGQSSAEVLLTDWFAGEEPCWITPANLVLLLRQALGRDVSRGLYAPVMSKLGFKSKPHRDGEVVRRGWVRGMPSANAPGYGAQLSVTGRPALQRLLEPPRPASSLPALPY